MLHLPRLLRFISDFLIDYCWFVGGGRKTQSSWPEEAEENNFEEDRSEEEEEEGKEGENIKVNLEEKAKKSRFSLYGRVIAKEREKEICGVYVNEKGQFVCNDGSLFDPMCFYGNILNQVREGFFF